MMRHGPFHDGRSRTGSANRARKKKMPGRVDRADPRRAFYGKSPIRHCLRDATCGAINESSNYMPMPAPAPAFAFFSSGISLTTASVVRSSEAIEAAFCNAIRSTFAGTKTPI